MGKRKQERGSEGFERYYRDLYGDRWRSLKPALFSPGNSVGLQFADGPVYYLDAASLLAAMCLDLEGARDIVDLCAAPGGKTLVLAGSAEESARLTANERSAARRARLHRVIDAHLPASAARIEVTGHDAARWALHRPESADAVLADVPCSSEQHVLQSAGALAEWSPSRTKRLAGAAYAIACAAADALRPGGTMVYSTCALSSLENDHVIERLVNRSNGTLALRDPGATLTHALQRLASGSHRFRLIPPSGPEFDPSSQRASFLPVPLSGKPVDAETLVAPGEKTSHGWIILPDASPGMGPIYFSILDKQPCLLQHAP